MHAARSSGSLVAQLVVKPCTVAATTLGLNPNPVNTSSDSYVSLPLNRHIVFQYSNRRRQDRILQKATTNGCESRWGCTRLMRPDGGWAEEEKTPNGCDSGWGRTSYILSQRWIRWKRRRPLNGCYRLISLLSCLGKLMERVIIIT